MSVLSPINVLEDIFKEIRAEEAGPVNAYVPEETPVPPTYTQEPVQQESITDTILATPGRAYRGAQAGGASFLGGVGGALR